MPKGELTCEGCGQYESECKCPRRKMETKDWKEIVMTVEEIAAVLIKRECRYFIPTHGRYTDFCACFVKALNGKTHMDSCSEMCYREKK